MRPKTLLLFLKARNRERSTQVYTCDALWIIASSLGNKLPRYSEIINKQATKTDNKKTSEEVVNGIISALKKDMERRLKHGDSSI